MDKRLFLDPDDNYDVDCYPDVEIAGLFGHKYPQDSHCVQSRTGYGICLAGCPALWVSKFQIEITFSTLESECVALSTACKDLLTNSGDIVKEVGTVSGLPVGDLSNMHVCVHKDNVGALPLGNLEPQCMTLRSKHNAIKYHRFC